jgi:hypothetical protein
VRANAAQTIVRAFINEHCVVDLRPGNFIDLESKARPGVEAFKPLLKRWCAAKGIQVSRGGSNCSHVPSCRWRC